MTATTTAAQLESAQIEAAPFKLQKKDALLKPAKDWGEDPEFEVGSEIASVVPVVAAKASVKISDQNLSLRQVEEQRVRWAIAQAEVLYSLYSKVDDSETSFDKEWKATLKWETDGDITPGQAEKLINIAQVLKESNLINPEKRFSVTGLTEWSRVPGQKIRDRILELAISDDAEFGESLLTSKKVKQYHGIALAETSDAVPDAVRDEVNALSGSAKLKARKELVTYVKEAGKIDSPEIVQSLRKSTDKKAQKGSQDIQSLLKELARDAKSLAQITQAIEFIPDGKVEQLAQESLDTGMSVEVAKAIKSAQKRTKAANDLPKAMADTLKMCDEVFVTSSPTTPTLRALVASLSEGTTETSEGQQLFLPLSSNGSGYQVSLKFIPAIAA